MAEEPILQASNRLNDVQGQQREKIALPCAEESPAPLTNSSTVDSTRFEGILLVPGRRKASRLLALCIDMGSVLFVVG